MRLLAISGSLRRASLSSAALHAAVRLAPSAVEVIVDTRLRTLPLYDYDLDRDAVPEVVVAFRGDVAASNGLVIASPEYAHGVAGPMKNALDWLVGDVDFPGKPIALWNTSPRATHAQSHLREVLTTMSARIVDEASLTLPLLGADGTTDAILDSAEMSTRIHGALASLVRAVHSRAG